MGCNRRATKLQANFSATLRAAVLFRADFVARSLQIHGGYARRSRLVRTKNSVPRMYSYFGETTQGEEQKIAKGAKARQEGRVGGNGFFHSPLETLPIFSLFASFGSQIYSAPAGGPGRCTTSRTRPGSTPIVAGNCPIGSPSTWTGTRSFALNSRIEALSGIPPALM